VRVSGSAQTSPFGEVDPDEGALCQATDITRHDQTAMP
jgi:hypothetical protein